MRLHFFFINIFPDSSWDSIKRTVGQIQFDSRAATYFGFGTMHPPYALSSFNCGFGIYTNILFFNYSSGSNSPFSKGISGVFGVQTPVLAYNNA